MRGRACRSPLTQNTPQVLSPERRAHIARVAAPLLRRLMDGIRGDGACVVECRCAALATTLAGLLLYPAAYCFADHAAACSAQPGAAEDCSSATDVNCLGMQPLIVHELLERASGIGVCQFTVPASCADAAAPALRAWAAVASRGARFDTRVSTTRTARVVL